MISCGSNNLAHGSNNLPFQHQVQLAEAGNGYEFA